MSRRFNILKRIAQSAAILGILAAATGNAQVTGPAPTTASGFRMYNSSTEWITIRSGATGTTGTFLWPAPTAGVFTSDMSGQMSIGALNLANPQYFTGILAPVNGGTGISSVGPAGSIAYSNGTNFAFTAAGTAGQVLRSAGAGTPVWQTVLELPTGSTTNSSLVWNGTSWVENTNLISDPTPGGGTTIKNTLTVATGGDVVFPNGVINNNELQFSSFGVSYGTGVTGDASVSLGGTLNIQNSGVTSLLAGPGISVSGATGAVTVGNTGVLSVAGTTNQVNVSGSTGNVTFSLPQDIHTAASPTFSGLTLSGLTAGTSNQVLVRNTTTNAIESRTIFTLPGGSTANTTLRWDGTNWVENTNVKSDAAGNTTIGGTATVTGNTTLNGDLTVSTGDVVLPNGVINNNELQNSSFTVNYGAGVTGDPSVSLGGTLNIQNSGVTSLVAGPGISVSGGTGAVTVGNTGVLSVAGTTNQVSVDNSTGNVTFSLPQDIDQNATPTFNSLKLDAVSGSSTSSEVLVLNGINVESRTIYTLPGGGAANNTLRWDGTNWVTNTGFTSDATGNASINGTTVTVPNIPTATSASTVVITDGSNNLQEISVDNLLGSATLTKDNIWVGNGANKPGMVAPGTDGQVLQINGTTPTWQTIDGTDLALTQNAMLVGGPTNKATEIAGGTSGQVLQINGTGVPTWTTPVGTVKALGTQSGTGTWTYTITPGVNPTGRVIQITVASTAGSGSAPQVTYGISNVTATSFDVEFPINLGGTEQFHWIVY